LSTFLRNALGDNSPTMPRPQFRLRSLFLLTAIVAMGCLAVSPARSEYNFLLAYLVVWLAAIYARFGTVRPE
jgi:hypothetical protein